MHTFPGLVSMLFPQVVDTFIENTNPYLSQERCLKVNANSQELNTAHRSISYCDSLYAKRVWLSKFLRQGLLFFIIKVFWTIVFIFIVISTTFRPICPPVFFRCLSNSWTFTEIRTTSFIQTTRVACSDSVCHKRVQVLLACSEDRTCNLQIIKMKTIVRKTLMIKINVFDL